MQEMLGVFVSSGKRTPLEAASLISKMSEDESVGKTGLLEK
jgi:hypothetical protein